MQRPPISSRRVVHHGVTGDRIGRADPGPWSSSVSRKLSSTAIMLGRAVAMAAMLSHSPTKQ
jgi:hypothetical protein